jgi:hypothetical protein
VKDEVYCYKRRIEACLRKIRNSGSDEESKQKILYTIFLSCKNTISAYAILG